MNRRYLAPVLVTLTLLTTAGAAVAVDVFNQPGSCQQDAAQSPVIAEFTIASGSAITERFPGFGKAPELDAMAGPLHVVAFAEHHGVPIFGQLRADDAAEQRSSRTWCAS